MVASAQTFSKTSKVVEYKNKARTKDCTGLSSLEFIAIYFVKYSAKVINPLLPRLTGVVTVSLYTATAKC